MLIPFLVNVGKGERYNLTFGTKEYDEGEEERESEFCCASNDQQTKGGQKAAFVNIFDNAEGLVGYWVGWLVG